MIGPARLVLVEYQQTRTNTKEGVGMSTFYVAPRMRVGRASLGRTTGMVVQGVFPGPLKISGHLSSTRSAVDMGNFGSVLGWARLPRLITNVDLGYHSFRAELRPLPDSASSMLPDEIIQHFPNRLTPGEFFLLLAQYPQLQLRHPLITYWVDAYPQLVLALAAKTTTGKRSLYVGHGQAYEPRGSECRIPVRVNR